tara:strand:- start:476 stop:1075 length:600 start_codon:yes stop_codon:yes gene_type:complete
MTLIVLPSTGRWSEADMQFITGDTPLELMNGAEQIISSTNKKWAFSFKLIGLYGVEVRAWRSALTQLCDLGNTFQAPPPDFDGPGSGYAGPNPLVAGSSQLGLSVNVDGGSLSTQILANGDYFTINGELKVATADVTTDGTGAATIPFYPALRSSPLDNAEVFIDAPFSTFRLMQPMSREHFNAVLHGSRSVEAVETYS